MTPNNKTSPMTTSQYSVSMVNSRSARCTMEGYC